MAKTLVEKEICDACGADVRPDSLFCYNCGGPVSEEAQKTGTNNNLKTVGSDHLKTNSAGTSDFKTTPLNRQSVESLESQPVAKPIEKPASGKLPANIEEKPPEKASIQEDSKLKSAANLRRKAKIYQKKTVEVVWEEPESAPNKWFPIVAILLILLVVGIFYLAMYLR
ncbi:MAG TPA: zinc ribbon domain-containing protein [Pyrinomonadaceae bacterium]|jgi:hypothetical protein